MVPAFAVCIKSVQLVFIAQTQAFPWGKVSPPAGGDG